MREALGYSAQLRLPADAARDEIEGAVDRVLDELALEQHADTRIGSLSGGQRKRVGRRDRAAQPPEPAASSTSRRPASIPGLETRMMELLRELADNARAVIVVTHATKNLGLCDKLVVMGRGGKLCFHGPPDEALRVLRRRRLRRHLPRARRAGPPRSGRRSSSQSGGGRRGPDGPPRPAPAPGSAGRAPRGQRA